MTFEAALALLLLLLAASLLYRQRIARSRERTGLPPGDVVYQDTEERLDKTLYSRRYHLTGRPDHVVWEDGYYIPVEVKTGRTPRTPYWGQVMQLMAYCILVEENYGVRPPYGVILYQESGQRFWVEFTADHELALAQILDEMRSRRTAVEVHRSHGNPRICAQCGYHDRCEERIG